ncbi:thiol peroxidase [Flagellimonas hymeniacidonis]|uniref:Thiol peroxidase n=1 Tax=Flagellimonas hymeniacidonis TaxID=2603628 RepID=A0A5C8V2Z9_9FLAO|nr:thiol peroxidase [Flagellimonas hymeniacidonis]TXN35519.1 thiol peroxidase [Flagellimonas hymeniacidonis]
MASIKLGGNPANTVGELPSINTTAPNFKLTKSDLSEVSLSDYSGQKVVLNIFPSVDTGTCAKSVRQFNEEAAKLENTKILCISKDLPFAQTRFCGAEGIENVEMLSDYKTGSFGQEYGVAFADSAFESLLSRSIVVLNQDGQIIHTEQVQETADEPNYKAALQALMNA